MTLVCTFMKAGLVNVSLLFIEIKFFNGNLVVIKWFKAMLPLNMAIINGVGDNDIDGSNLFGTFSVIHSVKGTKCYMGVHLCCVLFHIMQKLLHRF